MTLGFWDSSAFLKLLIDEDGTDTAVRLWDDADGVAASRLAFPEVAAAVEAGRRNHRLTARAAKDVHERWQDLWASVTVVELTAPVARTAAGLAANHPLSGADAVHLASALALTTRSPVVVCWDRRLSAAAIDVGLAVVPSDF